MLHGCQCADPDQENAIASAATPEAEAVIAHVHVIIEGLLVSFTGV